MGYRPITITIGITDRYEYVKICMETLQKAIENCKNQDFLKNVELVLSVEPLKDGSQVLPLLENFDCIKRTLIINSKRLGVRMNPYRVINEVFSKGSEFNLHLEDDIEYSIHLINLLEWYYNTFKSNLDEYFTYGFFNYIDKQDVSTKYKNNLNEVVVGGFHNLGWACSKNSWKEIKDIWFKDLKTSKEGVSIGWDWTLKYYIEQNNKKCLHVVYPYTKHIGIFGVHCTPSINDRFFNHIVLNNEKEVPEFKLIV